MRKIFSIVALASLGFSANIAVMPYGAYVNYSDKALKDDAVVGGIYVSCFNSPFKFELDAESTKITYKNTIPDWNQKDLTGVAHYYIGNNWDVKVGMHNIFIDQDNNPDNYDRVFFGGILYYKYLKYNTGLDYYYSQYDHFHVNQVTAKAGVNFGNYYSAVGSFYTEARVNYIKISGNSGAKKDDYTNVDLKLQNYQGRWMTELYGNVGKNAYKVARDGFVIYNLGEEYKYSAGLDINYYIDKTMSLKVGFSRSKYEINNKNAYSNAYTVSFVKSF